MITLNTASSDLSLTTIFLFVLSWEHFQWWLPSQSGSLWPCPAKNLAPSRKVLRQRSFHTSFFFSAVGQRWPHPNLDNHNIKDTDLSSLSFSNRPLFYDSFTLSSRRVIIITVYPGSQNKMSSRRAACLGLHTGGGDSSLGHRFVVDQIEREERSWPPYSD